MIFYNPDIVLADGAIQGLVRLLQLGKRAIQVVGLRVIKDEVVPLLMEQHSSDGQTIVVSPRELMALAMKHLHPISAMHFYDAPDLDLMPQETFWTVPDEGIVARCLHIHPILVYPRVPTATFTTTVDDDYLRAACPDPEDEYVVTDSDEFCLCELSPKHRVLIGLPRTDPEVDIARWALDHAKPHHFEHFCRRILLHAGRKRQLEWQAACAQSDQVVGRILERVLDMRAGG